MDYPSSSHVGIDDTRGTIGQYVHRDKKAWTQANANPVAVAAELCAFAAWDEAEWARHPVMLDNLAQWVAEEAMFFGIPIRKLTAAEAQGGAYGVCQHIDLGGWGGGHVDCDYGNGNFPIDDVILNASLYAVSPARPRPRPKEEDVFIEEDDGRLYWFIADGERSYWRRVPDGQRQNIPAERRTQDPNGDWLEMWERRG